MIEDKISKYLTEASKYPELNKITKDISRLVGDEINKRTEKLNLKCLIKLNMY